MCVSLAVIEIPTHLSCPRISPLFTYLSYPILSYPNLSYPYRNSPRTGSVGTMCAPEECPRNLPFTCGIFCTKNAVTCSKEIAEITSIGYKIVVDAQAGNWPAVILVPILGRDSLTHPFICALLTLPTLTRSPHSLTCIHPLPHSPTPPPPRRTQQAKKLYTKLKGWPSCSDAKQTEEEMVAQILAYFKNFQKA